MTSTLAHPAPILSADRPATRLATRLLFLVAGFGYSCWAPLVPFTKARLGIDEHVLGLLLLCMGGGSITAMVVAGMLSARFGNRAVLVGSGFGFAAALACLPAAGTIVTLGLALAAFGATLGALDVAMNVHAVEVERASSQPLMSGFHALFSIGGFGGAAFMTFLLSRQVDTLAGTLVCAALLAVLMLLAAPRLLRDSGGREGPLFVLPRGLVLAIALLACITFLVEGALLDWGALLITEGGLVAVARGGTGYMLFSIAMTAGRLSGDAVAARIGDRLTLLGGGVLALGGFAVLLVAAGAGHAAIALSGFVLIGLGCSNIVPVLFRRAASQHAMAPGLAVAAISTTGYAGILAGPAGIGFIARAVGLPVAFWILAGLLALVPLCAGAVTRSRDE